MAKFIKDLNYYEYRAKNVRAAIKGTRKNLNDKKSSFHQGAIDAHEAYIEECLKELKQLNKKIKEIKSAQ